VVASDSTCWRLLDQLDAACIGQVAPARAAAREVVWAQRAEPQKTYNGAISVDLARTLPVLGQRAGQSRSSIASHDQHSHAQTRSSVINLRYVTLHPDMGRWCGGHQLGLSAEITLDG
jgi:hypothetical protein